MRRYKAYFIVILLQIWGLSVVAQDSTTQLLLLPKGGEVATIYFDPLECQTAGGLFYYKDDGKPPDMIYAIFNLGFQKPMLRWEKTNNKSWNLGIEVASYTQFEFVDVEGSFKRYMLNSDFKFGIPLVYHHNKWSFRIRAYHLSTHMGDDYIFRYNIPAYKPKPITYEQLDVTAYYNPGIFTWYLSTGTVIRSNEKRKMFSAFGGFQFVQPSQNSGFVRWIGSGFLKVNAQTNYYPTFRMGTGLEFGQKGKNPFRLLLEYYHGTLPYGAYEFQKMQWIGVGLYFDPI